MVINVDTFECTSLRFGQPSRFLFVFPRLSSMRAQSQCDLWICFVLFLQNRIRQSVVNRAMAKRKYKFHSVTACAIYWILLIIISFDATKWVKNREENSLKSKVDEIPRSEFASMVINGVRARAPACRGHVLQRHCYFLLSRDIRCL